MHAAFSQSHIFRSSFGRIGLLAALLGLVIAPASRADISMPASPVEGNATDLDLEWGWPIAADIYLVIGKTAGDNQDSCYLHLYPTYQGWTAVMYDTTSGGNSPLADPQYGIVGQAQQYPQASMVTNACSLDLGASSVHYGGISLRLTMKPAAIGYNQVVADYVQWYTEDGQSWWNDNITATIGAWNSGPPAGPSAVLFQPAPNSVLTSTSTTFQWTPAVNAIQYCLDIGTSVGGNDIFTGCGAATSQAVSNLPSTGMNFYVTLTTNFPGVASIVNQYTVRAVDLSAPSLLTFSSSPTLDNISYLDLIWSYGVNVASTHAVITNQDNLVLQDTTSAHSAHVAITAATTSIKLSLSSQLVSSTAQAVNEYTFRRGPAPPSRQPNLSLNIPVGSDGRPTSSIGTLSWNLFGTHIYYYATVGKSPGSGQIFPGTSIPAHGTPFQGSSKNIDFSGFLDGRPVWISFYWSLNDGNDWNVETIPFNTPPGTIPAPAFNQMPAELYWGGNSSTTHASNTFYFIDGVGVDQYWLTAGTTPGAANLYNSFNGRQPPYQPTQPVATLEAFPSAMAVAYLTLYSNIGGVWYPKDYTIPFTEPPGQTLNNLQVVDGSDIYTNIYDCLNSIKQAQVTCTLPPGVFGLDGSQSTQGTISTNQFVINRSNLTLQGGGLNAYDTQTNGSQIIRATGATLTRTGASQPDNCHPLIQVSTGASNVKVMGITLDGNNQSFTDTCKYPNPNQPEVDDLGIYGNYPATTNGTIVDSVLLKNSAGHALSIAGTGINNTVVRNSHIVNAALTGLLVYSPNGDDLPGSPCDSRDPVAIDHAVYNVLIQDSQFDRSWTGATAFNYGKSLYIDRSYFFGNYWNPYDQAGGTSFVQDCVKDAKFTNSYFSGENAPTSTEGLEIHSNGVEISNNTIIGYQNDGISLRTAQNVTVTGNHILNNNQNLYTRSGGVYLSNVAGGRQTTEITFSNNTINNSGTTANLPASQQRGIAFLNCQASANATCTTNLIGTVRFIGGINDLPAGASGGNILDPNKSGKICTDDPRSPLVVSTSSTGNQDELVLGQKVRETVCPSP